MKHRKDQIFINFFTFPALRIGGCQNANFLSRKCHVSSHFLNTVQMGDSMVPLCITLSTSSGHMTFHEIFLNGKKQTALSTLQLASLPTLIEFAKCIRNLYYQGIISLWVWVTTFPVNVGNVQ